MANTLQRDSISKDWPQIRSAYIDADEKPTYTELADRFRLSLQAISNRAADEGWAMARARRLEQAEKKAEVSEALIELATERRETSSAIANAVLIGVRKLTVFLEAMPDDTKPKAGFDQVNTCFFGLANAAKALKDAGLVELPRSLVDGINSKGDAGKEFLKGALQQINITVQAAQSGAGSAVVDTPSKDDAPPP